jgi:nucleoside-diphosphate-sugar epimerase
MKKIAIIGLGWLGLPLYEFWNQKGVDCCGSTSSHEKTDLLKKRGIHAFFYNSNVVDFTEIRSISASISHLIVCIPPSKTAQDYATELVKIISFFSKTCKIVFTSSTSVYPDLILEAHEEYVFTPQDETKALVQAEITLKKLFWERLCILRFAGLIGPQRHPAKFFAGKTNLPMGNIPVNLVHLLDCIRIIDSVIEQELWGEIFNVCASIHPTKKEYYSKSCEILNLERPTFLEDFSTGKSVSNAKSKKSMGNYIMDDPKDYFEMENVIY